MLEISKNKENKSNNINQKKRIIISKKNKFKQKGNYILEDTIGEGAFAKVKLAKHIITGEKVAIKILPKRNIISSSYLSNKISKNNISKIKNEINILRRLHHKNIIQLYEIIETKNNLYIVMEYCEGKELFDYIVKRKRLTEREACRYFQQIINGVEYLHLCNITHRDLKPENILLDNKKRIRISDFGLSAINSNDDSLLSTPCGTPLYAPPEMLRGEKYEGVYSDIWSCGIILYIMLVGDLPYADSKEKIIYQNIMTHNYYYPEYLNDDAVDLIEHMLKINPKERYGFKEIKAHPWFNLITPKLRPGIIYKVHKMPVDEKILDKIERMGFDRNLCKKSILENNYDSFMAIYLLTLKQRIREGIESISDLFSDEYINFINDYKNWLDTSKINSPLFNEYNVRNIPNNDLSEDNSNSGVALENLEALSDSEKLFNTFDNNFDNISNEEKKEYYNIIKKHSNEANDSFNNLENGNKRLILKKSLMKEMNSNVKKDNDKSFDSSNFSYTINFEDGHIKKSNINYNLTLNNVKITPKKKLRKNEKKKKFNKLKGLTNLKIEIKNNSKLEKNKNVINQNLNIEGIIQKRILTKQNTEKISPSKYDAHKTKINKENTSFLSPILNNKLINNNVKVNSNKNKKIFNLSNNDLNMGNNLEETEFLDKIFNDNLIDLENESKLILTPSAHFHSNNSESKTLFSKDDNTNISFISRKNNNTINIMSKKNDIKKLKMVTDFKNSNNNNYTMFSKNENNSMIKKSNKQNKDNLLLLTEPLDIDIKNKLKKEIEDDLNKFDNDLTILDKISKIKFIKYQDNINIKENLGIFNIQDLAEKLIQTSSFKNYIIRNKKKIKNEIEDKFYILEKYKNAIGLIEKLKNKTFVEKLSNFNFYTFDQYLKDDDDKVISNALLKNKRLSLFIKKAKETVFKKSNIIDKKSYSKNYSFRGDSLFNENNVNLKNRSKTPKSKLNNIIINKTKNYFYKQKYNKDNIYNNSFCGSVKTSLVKRSIKNKNRINSQLNQNHSPNTFIRKSILSHSIEIRKNNNSISLNKDYSKNKIKNKSIHKRLLFKNKFYLTENKFSTTLNSISNFNLENSNSSFNSIIIEEGHDNNDSHKHLNIEKINISESNNKIFNKNKKGISLYNNKFQKNKKLNFNSIINNVNIENSSDNKLINIFLATKKLRNRTIEKRIDRKNRLPLTPESKNSKKYKRGIINHSINDRKLKTVKFFDSKKNNVIINDKQKHMKKIVNNIKIKNKIRLKALKENCPIDINCIFLISLDEIKLKIKKYFKKVQYSVNEKDNNIKIIKNGLIIEVNFYTLKDLKINNVYVCFKFKGEKKTNNLEIINDLLHYIG